MKRLFFTVRFRCFRWPRHSQKPEVTKEKTRATARSRKGLTTPLLSFESLQPSALSISPYAQSLPTNLVSLVMARGSSNFNGWRLTSGARKGAKRTAGKHENNVFFLSLKLVFSGCSAAETGASSESWKMFVPFGSGKACLRSPGLDLVEDRLTLCRLKLSSSYVTAGDEFLRRKGS